MMKLVTPLLLGVLVMMTWPIKANASGSWQCPNSFPDTAPINQGRCIWVEDSPPPSNPIPSPSPSPSPEPVFDPKKIKDVDFSAIRNKEYGFSFIAVAWHPNASDVWATWNQRNEPQANQTVLNACTQAMGKGCVVVINGWDGSAAIVRDRTNNLWKGWGKTPQQAREVAMRSCQSSNQGCELVHTFTSEPLKQQRTRSDAEYVKFLQDPAFDVSKSYTPKLRGFLAIAWTGSSWQTWPNLLVASGYPTLQAAETVASDRCQAQSKQSCISFGIADDRQYPLFAVYLSEDNRVYWFNSTTEQNLEKMATDRCRERGVTCQQVGFFDARRSGLSIHPIKK